MIHRVDRLDDPRTAPYARVGDPSYLRDNGLFVAEGRLVVRRLFEARRYDIESVFVTPAALREIADVLPEDLAVYVAEQPFLNAIAGFNFHRGCLAIARRPAPLEASDLVSPFTGDSPRPPDLISPVGDAPDSAARLLGLEGIGNPDNVGGIFRVAAAFGVEGVVLDPASADPFYRKAIRTSMGATLNVPFARARSWPADLEPFKARGFRVMALTPRQDARAIEDVVGGNRAARWLVLAGAEGPGLSQAALAAADVPVRIPMGARVDSLNVTVAMGIALSRLFVAPRGVSTPDSRDQS